MKIREVMTEEPVCCTKETLLQDVARLMLKNDCGSIPVVDSKASMRLIGIITDRDITCRAVAEGMSPRAFSAGDCMSTSVTSVTPDTSLEECCSLMEHQQIRRIPVVDKNSVCCGVVAQADLARLGPEKYMADVVREVSQPAASHQIVVNG